MKKFDTKRAAPVLAGIAALVIAAHAGNAGAASPGDEDARRIFSQRCTACHTFGHGIKVGPDLKGVASRRTTPWLLRFIRSSQTVIKSADVTAVRLFREFREQRMPDWIDLTEGQIKSIVGWLAANGPEQKEADEVDAALASASQLELARDLFAGRQPLASGGMACQTCHAITSPDGRTKGGGTLGPDLTGTYGKYQDRALTLFFRRPCFEREPDSSASRYLTPEESFALKAFLRRAWLTAGERSRVALWEGAGSTPGSATRTGTQTRGAP